MVSGIVGHVSYTTSYLSTKIAVSDENLAGAPESTQYTPATATLINELFVEWNSTWKYKLIS